MRLLDAQRPPAAEPAGERIDHEGTGSAGSVPHGGTCVMACNGHVCGAPCRIAVALDRIAGRLVVASVVER
jgi:hypothetical protein